MVKIRLRKIGRKKLPIYQVVAIDSRKKRQGAFIEELGRYEPKKSPSYVSIKEDRVLHWLDVGAQTTDTVGRLIRSTGVLYRRALKKRGMHDQDIDSAIDEWKQSQEKKRERILVKKKVRKKRKKSSESSTDQTLVNKEESGKPETS